MLRELVPRLVDFPQDIFYLRIKFVEIQRAADLLQVGIGLIVGLGVLLPDRLDLVDCRDAVVFDGPRIPTPRVAEFVVVGLVYLGLGVRNAHDFTKIREFRPFTYLG